MNPDVKDTFVKRSRIISSIRKYLDGQGFMVSDLCSTENFLRYIAVQVLRQIHHGEEPYKAFKKMDIGDIVGIEGQVFKTKTGEISIHAESVTLLTKSLQVLPEKFHGLTLFSPSCTVSRFVP